MPRKQDKADRGKEIICLHAKYRHFSDYIAITLTQFDSANGTGIKKLVSGKY